MKKDNRYQWLHRIPLILPRLNADPLSNYIPRHRSNSEMAGERILMGERRCDASRGHAHPSMARTGLADVS